MTKFVEKGRLLTWSITTWKQLEPVMQLKVYRIYSIFAYRMTTFKILIQTWHQILFNDWRHCRLLLRWRVRTTPLFIDLEILAGRPAWLRRLRARAWLPPDPTLLRSLNSWVVVTHHRSVGGLGTSEMPPENVLDASNSIGYVQPRIESRACNVEL